MNKEKRKYRGRDVIKKMRVGRKRRKRENEK